MLTLSIVAVVCLLVGFGAGVVVILLAADFPKEPDMERRGYYQRLYAGHSGHDPGAAELPSV
jgi:hypothetical protein